MHFFIRNVLTTFVFFLSSICTAADIEFHMVNGFRVILVDMHVGNGVYLATNVLTGSAHDPQDLAGRSHYLEHTVFTGSERYPGHKYYDQRMQEIGGEDNAETSTDHTFYWWFGNPASFADAADLLGSTLLRPKFNPSAARAELNIVKNEALEIQGDELEGFLYAFNRYLFPTNHPMAKFDLGTQDQLSMMSLKSVKSLFYANHIPGSMDLFVAANFDDDAEPRIEKDTVLKVLKDSFLSDPNHPDPTEPPSRKLIMPPLTESGTLVPYLKYGTRNSDPMLKLLFEITDPIDEAAADLMIDYLTLEHEGSIANYLQAKDWILTLNLQREKLNNLHFVEVYMDLTEEGAVHHAEVVSAFLSAVHDLKSHGLPKGMLRLLKKMTQEAIISMQKDPHTLIPFFAELIPFGTDLRLALDPEAYYAPVDEKALKNVVDRVFRTERMLVGYQGREVAAKTRDEVFQLPYQRSDSKTWSAKWRSALRQGGGFTSSIQLKADLVSLPTRRKTLKGKTKIHRTRDGLGSWGVLKTKHQLPQAAGVIYLKSPRRSPQEDAALQIFLEAFRMRHEADWDLWQSQGVEVQVSGTPDEIIIMAEGNSGGIPNALMYTASSLVSFEPSTTELKSSRGLLLNDLNAAQYDFSGQTAEAYLIGLLRPARGQTPVEKQKSLTKMILKNVSTLVKTSWQRTDVHVSLYGDLQRQSLAAVKVHLADLFPSELRVSDREELDTGPPRMENQITYWQSDVNATKPAKIGWTRALVGPPAGSRGHAALTLLHYWLSNEVKLENRIGNELGYIHDVSEFEQDQSVYTIFIGQTSGHKNFHAIPEGWDAVLHRLKERQISPQSWEQIRRTVVRNEQISPYHYQAHASSLHKIELRILKNQQPDTTWIELLQAVTVDEIYDIAERYLFNAKAVDVLVGPKLPRGISCDRVFSDPAAAHKKIWH